MHARGAFLARSGASPLGASLIGAWHASSPLVLPPLAGGADATRPGSRDRGGLLGDLAGKAACRTRYLIVVAEQRRAPSGQDRCEQAAPRRASNAASSEQSIIPHS